MSRRRQADPQARLDVTGRLLAATLAVAAVVGAVLVSRVPAAGEQPADTARRGFNAFREAAASTNWSGYAVSGSASAYRAVSGSWVQPAARCTRGAPSYASFWVGLGGFAAGSQALEQIGTSSDCSAPGKAGYTVWYELVPAAAVPVRLRIAPGDSISAVVVVSGHDVTLRLRNVTRRTVFTKRLTMSAPDVSSAEWIAEAPSECDASWRCRVLPLSNFGTVAFSAAAAATTAAHAGTISDATWTATSIELVPGGGVAEPGGAVPSELSPDGSGFTVTWRGAAATARG